ncbi:hypothetical protein JCM10212_000925 [Sporobolomyces blumeae]
MVALIPALRPRSLVQLSVAAALALTLWLTYSPQASTSTPSSVAEPVTASTREDVGPVVLEASPPSVEHVDRSDSPAWKLSGPPETLKPCERIFLYTFSPWWGFASEFILYIRAKSVATRLGYTFLADDSTWNYGRLSSYFAPTRISCLPPNDWADHRKAYPLHQGDSWKVDKKGRPRSRIRFSRSLLSNLDDWTREDYFRLDDEMDKDVAKGLEELKRDDANHRELKDRWMLEQGKTLPGVFEAAFIDQAEAVRETWNLNEGMEREAAALEKEIERVRREHADESEGPVIGVHIRLGDKATEYVHDSEEMGITNAFGNLTVYLEAAHEAYARLVDPSLSPLSDGAARRRRRFSPDNRPTLLLMTAEPSIASKLALDPLSKPFKIIQTPPPIDVRLEGRDAILEVGRKDGLDVAGSGERAEGRGPKAYAVSNSRDRPTVMSAGYTQSAFNALPLDERIQHTRAFVRDLAVLTSDKVDAVVVSGASNIGRLAMLIGGVDAVVGPRDQNGVSLGGRIRSVDAHFYPTSYPSAVYSHLADVEDLDNAAVIPQEQLAREANERKLRKELKRKKKDKKQNG